MNRPALILASLGVFLIAAFGLALAMTLALGAAGVLLATRAVRALTGGRPASAATDDRDGIRRIWNDGRGTIIDM